MPRLQLQKLLVLAVLGITAAVVTIKYGDHLSLESLAASEGDLREALQQGPLTSYVVAFALYVVITGLSIPGATGLSLLYGWLFGAIGGVLLVSFASTTGATLAFLLSRYLFHDAIKQRFGEQLQQFNRLLEKEGPYYLFSLRLVPVVPFFVINVVMGLTPLKTPTFWWVSQLGMLPATVIYVYAGSAVPTLRKLAEQGVSGLLSFRMVMALALLAAVPLVVLVLRKRLGLKVGS